MEATLIYNHQAGGTSSSEIDSFITALHEAGYDAVPKATESVDDLAAALTDVQGLVVSAGGDGTARAIIGHLLHRPNVHFTPLPLGTANNICRNLDITGEPEDILRRLANPRRCGFDIGHLQAPWGEDYFLEGAGLGFFAEVLASYEPEKGKSVLRSLTSLVEIFQNGFSRETVLELPEQIVEEEFLLVEVLNTTAVGPHLKFAPDADPTDGLLNVVCIKKDQGENFLAYLRGLLTEGLPQLESVELYKVPELKIRWRGFPLHLDAVIHPPGFDFRRPSEESTQEVEEYGFLSSIRPYPQLPPDATLHFRLLPQAISLWLPEPQRMA